MPSLRQNVWGRRAAFCLLLLGVLATAYYPSLPELLRLPTLRGIAYSWDSATHAWRILLARNYFIPSGHHWGWDPYWYQGNVPFLLYPHLHYMALALLSKAWPWSFVSFFNTTCLLVLLAWPAALAAAMRHRGMLGAALAAAWLATVNSTYGGGISGLFIVGLLSHQVGLIIFVVFLYYLVIQEEPRLAGVWLGLLFLVHHHGTAAAAVVWVTALAINASWQRGFEWRRWLQGASFAVLVGAPTLLGLWHGRRHFGLETYFRYPEILKEVLAGTMVAPMPIIICVVALGAASVLTQSGEARRKALVLCSAGILMSSLSLQQWEFDVSLLDKPLRQLFRLRTLSYSFTIWAAAAAFGWRCCPRGLKAAALGLTIWGVVQSWGIQIDRAAYPFKRYREGNAANQDTRHYGRMVRLITLAVGERTRTLGVIQWPDPPVANSVQELVKHAAMPMIGGHGVEVTNVQNGGLTHFPARLSCDVMADQLRRYAVGYVIGFDDESREAFGRCLHRMPDIIVGRWWAFDTGWSWDTADERIESFSHNRYWTEYVWRLRPGSGEGELILPIAAVAPFAVSIDNAPVPWSATADKLVKVPVPQGAREIRLRYRGYPGEWASAAISFCALLHVVWLGRVRRQPTPDGAVSS